MLCCHCTNLHPEVKAAENERFGLCESFIREGYENESQDHNHAVKTAKRILNYTEAESRKIWRAKSVKANREDIKLLCD